MKANNKKNITIFSIIVIGILLIATVLTYFQTKKTQDVRIGAYDNGATVQFNPQAVTLNQGDSQSIDVVIDPTNCINPNNNACEISAFNFRFNFGPEIQITNIALPSDPAFSQIFIQPDPTTGYPIQSGQTAQFSASIPFTQTTGVTQPVVAVVITIQALSNTTSPTTLAVEPSTAEITDKATYANVADTLNFGTASITVGGGSTGYTVPTLHFSPANPTTPAPNGTFSIDVLLSTGGQDVGGVDVLIDYDQSLLSNPTVDVTNSVFTLLSGGPVDDGDKLAFSVTVPADPNAIPVNGDNLIVGTITFDAGANVGNAFLNYDFILGDPNPSNVAPFEGSSDILQNVVNTTVTIQEPVISPTPTDVPPTPTDVPPTPTPLPTGVPSPTPTITPVPSATPTATPVPTPTAIPTTPISIQLSWEGKQRAGVSLSGIPYEIRYRNSGTTTGSTPVTGTTASAGEISLQLEPGTYDFWIKTSGYLASRFEGRIVQAGTVLDFTNTPQRGGDIDIPEGGTMGSGLINSSDHGRFILDWYADVPSSDLDGSRQVNNLDYAVMRPNFGLSDDTF
jgi:hypothetical protein